MKNYSINDITQDSIKDVFNPNNLNGRDSFKKLTLSDVAKSQTAINLLVEFQNSGGQLIYDPNANGANAQGKKITIGGGSNGAFETVQTLAHELGHGIGRYQNLKPLSEYATARDFANSRAKAEGEAIYYEFLVIRELGITTMPKPLWKDDDVSNINVPGNLVVHDIYKRC